MPEAYVDAADVRFPKLCIRCQEAPETTYTLRARSGVDLIFVGDWEFTHLPLPSAAGVRDAGALPPVFYALAPMDGICRFP